MAERMTVPASSLILGRLSDFCGMPVRVTVLDPDSKERLDRVAGVLSAVSALGLTVDCLRVTGPLLSGTPVTLEILVNGNLVWGHSVVLDQQVRGQSLLYLQAPVALETLQRRRHPRIDLEIPLHLVVPRTGETLECLLRDLSAGGAAFQTPEPLGAGESVQLVFDLGTGMFLQDLQAETVRCTDAPGGSYTVAVRFVTGHDYEEKLSAWVDKRLGQ